MTDDRCRCRMLDRPPARRRGPSAGAVASVWLGLLAVSPAAPAEEPGARPNVEVRGVYGGVPTSLLDRGPLPAESGIDAVWVGSGSLGGTDLGRLKRQGVKV